MSKVVSRSPESMDACGPRPLGPDLPPIVTKIAAFALSVAQTKNRFSGVQNFARNGNLLHLLGVGHPCVLLAVYLLSIYMRQISGVALFLVLIVTANAASKPHIVAFGKWQTVTWSAVGREKHPLELKMRPLYVDGKTKEYTTGSPRDITEKVFVVRRVFQLNDALPDETRPRWRWERGAWITVDRSTGRVSPVSLPYFHNFHSAAVWYRDYVAYCGTSDDISKVYAVVVQLGHRKPVFRQALSGAALSADPDTACSAPVWERDPPRVSFKINGEPAASFSLGPSESVPETEEPPQTSE
jgi:hypothetical protein